MVANGEIYTIWSCAGHSAKRGFARARLRAAVLSTAGGRTISAGGLRGMYAIARHDPETGGMHLASDPFGIKPLYTARRENMSGLHSTPSRRPPLAAGIVPPREEAAASEAECWRLQFPTGRETISTRVR